MQEHLGGDHVSTLQKILGNQSTLLQLFLMILRTSDVQIHLPATSPVQDAGGGLPVHIGHKGGLLSE